MKIPKLQSAVKDIFADGNTEVSCDISPDEVLALGAAKQAGDGPILFCFYLKDQNLFE